MNFCHRTIIEGTRVIRRAFSVCNAHEDCLSLFSLLDQLLHHLGTAQRLDCRHCESQGGDNGFKKQAVISKKLYTYF